MTYQKDPKSSKFFCEKCSFTCDKKSLWDRHVLTPKHSNTYSTGAKYLQKYLHESADSKKFNCVCGKEYTHRQSLFNHRKKCIAAKNQDSFSKNEIINITETPDATVPSPKPINMDIESLTVLLIDTVKQNNEMQKQNQDFQQKMFEIMKDNMGGSHNNINSNNNTNSHNNFNLNFFLNETCKDAMNIKEFIDSLQVHFKDLEYNGENGYAAGISNIFLRELNQLDVCKRPIHCSDVKREVFHIKNEDSWEKERELLIKCIKQITRKNVILLADWRTANPGCMDLDNRKNNQYNKINCETLGPYLDDEELKCFNKIISSVAKATVIDKKSGGGAPRPPPSVVF